MDGYSKPSNPGLAARRLVCRATGRGFDGEPPHEPCTPFKTDDISLRQLRMLVSCAIAAACGHSPTKPSESGQLALHEVSVFQGDTSCYSGCPWPVAKIEPTAGVYEVTAGMRHTFQLEYSQPKVCGRSITIRFEMPDPLFLNGATNCIPTSQNQSGVCEMTTDECQDTSYKANTVRDDARIKWDVPTNIYHPGDGPGPGQSTSGLAFTIVGILREQGGNLPAPLEIRQDIVVRVK
jgi:hypothetical protein